MLPSGVVTFLLTDIVGSTQLWETDATAMAAALERHDALVAAAVARAGGHLIKARGEGDATFSVFQRATDAVNAASEIQRSVGDERWPDATPIRLRIALHTGEAVERDGDYFGGTVNRSARLRGVAEPGQVVLSQTTNELVVDHLPANLTSRPLGERHLDGLARPEVVHELRSATDAGTPPAGPSGDGLSLRLLGGFDVSASGRRLDLGPPKQRAVLAVLALESGRVVPTDRLLDLLWDDPARGLPALQTYVSNLRRVLEPGRRPRDPARVLVTEAPGYRLVLPPEAVDTLRFEDLVHRGRELLLTGDAAGASAALDAALDTWGGSLLPELAEEPFVLEAAGRLDTLRTSALGLAGQARLDTGDALGAVTLLEGAASEHPLDEHLHRVLALALYRCGRQADALRTIERVRRALADTAGLDPSPDLRALEAGVLDHSLDGPPTGAARAPVGAAPDPGPPPPSASAGPSILVGRGAELDRLVAALDAARAGQGGAAVVVGEPGIGKTRLTEALAETARGRGVTVAWVRCPESGAIPPFWPAAQLAEQVQRAGAVDQGLTPPDDAEVGPSTLFTLYQGVSDALVRSATPLLLVLDDLQWADADSLRMLAHVAGSLASAPVLVAVTVRPLEEASPAALADALEALARTSGAVHVQLGGLTRDAVVEWLERRSDVEVPAAVASTVHERTGGNPLFVKELSELLAAEGRLGDVDAVQDARSIPTGVQSVVRRRVARLPGATQQLLSTASVVGRSFDLAVLAAVAGTDDALDDLEPALGSGLVLDESPGRFRFSHALVAETLAAELNAARRARIHAATARVLADRAGGVRGPDVTLIAHHAVEGLPAGAGELAIEASTEAARLAAASFGYEDAAGHWRRAADALASVRPADHDARIDALCELGATCQQADLVQDAKVAVLEAMDLASSAGRTTDMGRAAALLGRPHLWPNQRYGEVDAEVVAALERTVRGLEATDEAMRARVLGALAVELTYATEEQVTAVRVEAEDTARRSGDPAVLANVLLNVADPLSPSKTDLRMARATEVIALVAEHDLPAHIELVARFHLSVASWELADFPAALRSLDACRALAERTGGGSVRAQLAFFHAATATALGRYDEALRLGTQGSELYRRTRRYDAEIIELALFASIAADRGGLEQSLEQLDTANAESPNYDRLSAEFSSWLLLEAGQPERAASVVASIDPTVPLGDDYTKLCGTAFALHVRAELGDVAAVAELAGQLAPYRGRWSQAGTGGCSGGLVDLALARAAAAMGDTDRARADFETAVAGHERLGTPAWLARSLVHQGRFLIATGEEADRRAGEAALQRAEDLADQHGFPYVALRIARV
jgi:class 3 adenylate cyclase/DNA-binding SARP family transcriptional activator